MKTFVSLFLLIEPLGVLSSVLHLDNVSSFYSASKGDDMGPGLFCCVFHCIYFISCIL